MATPREHRSAGDPAGSEAAFLAGLRNDLDRSCERLPPGLRARLRERRRLALTPPSVPLWRRPWLAPMGGAVAMSLLAVLLLPGGLPLPGAETPVEALEDIDILAAGEELELLEEFEFYQWLADSGSP